MPGAASAQLTSLIQGTQPPGSDSPVARALQLMRSHLGMEVAYVSEFVNDRSVFREVDAPGLEALIKVGDSQSLDDVYCRHILAGRLPQLIPDTSQEPICVSLPITEAASIKSHISVPIMKADGEPYGMFCCVGMHTDPSLNARDLQMMNAFAELASFEINRDLDARKVSEAKHQRILDVIEGDFLSMVYQPIWDAATRRPVGVEALCRFSAEPRRSPDIWFNEAAEVGLGVQLEMAAIRKAMAALGSSLPDDVYVAVNASPSTILSPGFVELVELQQARRLVLEITEHAHVEDYQHVLDTIAPLRAAGVRLAVDDAGAGYSSLQHILQLQPDLIKLDMGLTRNVDSDPSRRALASALIRFAQETGSQIIAEGVETESELQTLHDLGADRVQGYFLGRPMVLADVEKLFAPPELAMAG
ncbi:MAG: diguanylate phosphodiesterase domain with sensor [Hyphomicrobiales bacterium]|jgi:EAL domain-containing protein (putative c-di-GMP-specific phosphodiesterase class I)|nr:diguanylate phosphodiesterase domain with sensor [Hyphomicrobiales bacterium]